MVEQSMLRKVTLEITVLDYDRIGKVRLGYSRKKLEKKHWAEMVDNPRRPVIHWHVLQTPEEDEEDEDEKKKDKKKDKDGKKAEGKEGGKDAKKDEKATDAATGGGGKKEKEKEAKK